MTIIGRKPAQQYLRNTIDSNKAAFIAVYGRRRIGKTYLLKNFFQTQLDIIFFYYTGLKDGDKQDQIENFTKDISKAFYNNAPLTAPKKWLHAFDMLNDAINIAPPHKKIVIFLDELPWMATPKSKVLQQLDYFWNHYWSHNSKVKLIICGSSASWIIKNIINNKGGLHNRITGKIHLQPFTLQESAEFLKHLGVNLTYKHILKIYMAIGGVPYYLEQVKPGHSAIEILSQLFFEEQSLLRNEYDNLFASLFNDATQYKLIISTLAKHPYGVGKNALLQTLGISASGGGGISKLMELEDAGFIMSFIPFGHKRQGIYYRLMDEYCSFYLKWVLPYKKSISKSKNFHDMSKEPGWNTWLGYSFEILCYRHLSEIQDQLDIKATAIPNAWRYAPKKHDSSTGAQIDLLFDRSDDAITICEIKYSFDPYVITKNDIDSLQRKINAFRKHTKTKKQIFISMITTQGLQNNYYADSLIEKVVAVEEIFE